MPADPIRPEAGCPLSNTVYYAMRRIVFSLDHDMDGRLGQADLLQPAARPFVAAAKIDVTSSEDEPTATGMLMKLADYPDGESRPETRPKPAETRPTISSDLDGDSRRRSR